MESFRLKPYERPPYMPESFWDSMRGRDQKLREDIRNEILANEFGPIKREIEAVRCGMAELIKTTVKDCLENVLCVGRGSRGASGDSNGAKRGVNMWR